MSLPDVLDHSNRKKGDFMTISVDGVRQSMAPRVISPQRMVVVKGMALIIMQPQM